MDDEHTITRNVPCPRRGPMSPGEKGWWSLCSAECMWCKLRGVICVMQAMWCKLRCESCVV
eukprot:307421-Pyramimonas_sp.AAC.1